MGEFVTVGDGWWVTEMGDDQAYLIFVARGPRPEGKGARLCGVAGGGDALEQMLEARAVEAVKDGPADRYLKKTAGIRRILVVPFAVDAVPARGKPGRIAIAVSLEQVDGKPLAVTGMEKVGAGEARGGRR